MSYITEKNVGDISAYINEIRAKRNEIANWSSGLSILSFMSGLAAAIPGVNVLAGIAGLTQAASGLYANHVAGTLTSFLEQLEDIEDILQNNGNTTLVRLSVTTVYDSFLKAEYPSRIKAIAYNINGNWVEIY